MIAPPEKPPPGERWPLRTIYIPNTKRIGITNLAVFLTIGSLLGENYIVDMALIYAMLGFVTVVIVCKAYLAEYKNYKKAKQQLEDLKAEIAKNRENEEFMRFRLFPGQYP